MHVWWMMPLTQEMLPSSKKSRAEPKDSQQHISNLCKASSRAEVTAWILVKPASSNTETYWNSLFIMPSSLSQKLLLLKHPSSITLHLVKRMRMKSCRGALAINSGCLPYTTCLQQRHVLFTYCIMLTTVTFCCLLQIIPVTGKISMFISSLN